MTSPNPAVPWRLYRDLAREVDDLGGKVSNTGDHARANRLWTIAWELNETKDAARTRDEALERAKKWASEDADE